MINLCWKNTLKLYLTFIMQYKVQLEKAANVRVCKALQTEEHLCVSECAHLNVSTCVWIAVLMDVPVHLVRRQWAQLLSMPAGH